MATGGDAVKAIVTTKVWSHDLLSCERSLGLRRGEFSNPDYSGTVFVPIYNLAMSIHPFTQKKNA